MKTNFNRRHFANDLLLATFVFVSASLLHVSPSSADDAVAVAATSSADSSSDSGGTTESAPKLKIIGVACSFRAGKTTAQSLQLCLDAAKVVAPDRIEVELIELAGLKLPAEVAAGIPLSEGERDDFPAIAEKLSDPNLAAVIIGTPVYYANMSSLCKVFIERCGVFRKTFALSGKVAGVIAVGGNRNGGQELVIQSVQASLMAHEMLVVGDGRPTGHFGGTLWNNGGDDITEDEFGVQTAQNLGRHVAEVALTRVSQ
ncbi:flavodoxin family protein [Novipirellula artificiosorum]|uniref:p-benzoquinone reductase n=1 Tax=Novipirellula artificiosorum TaxID=2528016 RepID=A0A5C6D2V8_9BACT|nr:flavodoxin family protein [Novipirellula artificiosorum]TWU31170.1 p-benzoquinone reductase [Novipirellula artificiosorum]